MIRNKQAKQKITKVTKTDILTEENEGSEGKLAFTLTKTGYLYFSVASVTSCSKSVLVAFVIFCANPFFRFLFPLRFAALREILFLCSSAAMAIFTAPWNRCFPV